MNALLTLFAHLAAQATGTLVSAIWQGALLAALVGICLRLFPGLSAAARSVIWLNVFVLLALLHLVPCLISSTGAQSGSGVVAHSVQLDIRWSLAATAVWLVLSLYRAGQLLVSGVHLHALANRATNVEVSADLLPLLRAPGNRRVQLSALSEVARPSVLGFFRPRILMPPAILEHLSPAELRQVVIHEMEHLRRGDDWTNLLQKLALVFFPLNPVLLWVERQICAERELACDDRVLRSGSGRRAYALCLTHLAEFSLMRRGFSLVLGAWERRPELVRRVQRILTQPARTMGRKPAFAATATLIAGALVCTLTLSHVPELVSFVPLAEPTQQSESLAPLNSAALGPHALGGAPHVVKAIMPGPWQPRTIPVKFTRRHRGRPQLQLPRLAALRIPPPLHADRNVMVMAQWTDVQNAARLTYAVSRQQQLHRSQVVQAVYVVRTPTGWLIIQI